jgi:hypothetical protein
MLSSYSRGYRLGSLSSYKGAIVDCPVIGEAINLMDFPDIGEGIN